MSTLETSATVPHQSKKKKKQTQVLADSLPTHGQAEPSGSHSKKRGRQDNSAEDERPRKKRNKGHKILEINSHSAESSNAPPVNVDTSATSKKGKKKRSKDGANGTNTDELVSEGVSTISPELHERNQSTSLTREGKKPKKRKDKQPQAVIPVDSHSSADIPDIPIDPELLGDFSYDPHALPFDDTIDFSAFGMGPGSSTDDVLRAIKTMDLSTLTKATGQEFLPSDDHGVSKKKRTPRSRNVVGQIYNPSDPQGLLQKWLSADKLKKLAEEHGLEYTKGSFTTTEKAAVQTAVETFAIAHGISEVDVVELMFIKRIDLQPEYKSLWLDIAFAVPKRPVVSVFNYCRRAYNPLQRLGKWTEEEDTALKDAVIEHGQMWQKVSGRVGRTSHDCRDRYRNHFLDAQNRVKGAWSKEEEAQLVEIMAEFNYEKPKGEENDTFWRQISHRMGGSRGRHQLRSKWEDSLGKTFKPDGQRRWLAIDAYILIHKIATMNVADESEIDWRLLGDEGWNLWSPHVMQKHWFSMKKSVDGYQTMPFYEILEILIAKKGSLTQQEIEDGIKKTQELRPVKQPREFTSKEFVKDSDEVESE